MPVFNVTSLFALEIAIGCPSPSVIEISLLDALFVGIGGGGRLNCGGFGGGSFGRPVNDEKKNTEVNYPLSVNY